MKKISFTLFIVLMAIFAIGQELALNTQAADNAVFNWSATEHDFGKIPAGTPVSHEFIFTNKGDAPLIISTVQASCGCTVTAYSKEPVEAGRQGFVKATYDAAKAGKFTKTVTVNANTEQGVVRLTIRGEVTE